MTTTRTHEKEQEQMTTMRTQDEQQMTAKTESGMKLRIKKQERPAD